MTARWITLAVWIGFVIGIPAEADVATRLYLDTYKTILSEHTRDTTRPAQVTVNYPSLKKDPHWRRLLVELNDVETSPTMPTDERLALFINAYNIFAIDIVVRHYPVSSIKEVGSFFSPVWKKEAGRIGGRPYSLDEIEHEFLRPLGEPRMHVAIVCASISCPPLRREPYAADRIQEQLEDQMSRFLGNTRKGAALDMPSRTLTLSPIFKWFREDFERKENLLSILIRHLHPADAKWVRDYHDVVRIRYFDTDWGLNE